MSALRTTAAVAGSLLLAVLTTAAGNAAVRPGTAEGAYTVDMTVTASDRRGLLRDIGDALAREKINVTAVRTQSRDELAFMRFTFDVSNIAQLKRALAQVRERLKPLATLPQPQAGGRTDWIKKTEKAIAEASVIGVVAPSPAPVPICLATKLTADAGGRAVGADSDRRRSRAACATAAHSGNPKTHPPLDGIH